MGQHYPKYPDDVVDGDDVAISPQKTHESLLAVEDGTQSTRRLVTDPQRRLKVVADVATTPSNFVTRSDTFTATGAGAVADASAFVARSYSIQVKGTGAPATSWNVQIEVSLDNVNFTSVMTHTNSVGDGMLLLSDSDLYPAP